MAVHRLEDTQLKPVGRNMQIKYVFVHSRLISARQHVAIFAKSLFFCKFIFSQSQCVVILHIQVLNRSPFNGMVHNLTLRDSRNIFILHFSFLKSAGTISSLTYIKKCFLVIYVLPWFLVFHDYLVQQWTSCSKSLCMNFSHEYELAIDDFLQSKSARKEKKNYFQLVYCWLVTNSRAVFQSY